MKPFVIVYLCLCTLALYTIVNADGGTVPNCCLKVSNTFLPISKIKSHYSQKKDGRCPVDAVVFSTVKEKTVCSDPKKTWVKRVIKQLENKKMTTQEYPSSTGNDRITVTPDS
ncbi:eotaxin-like [Polyodon spathula]|uniref:eotaxin-like n=1 Tax=Polyodon spathula TaxID=7913 RepID=UPI001B7EAE4E|nr:eotaxin-like [Polyodon spathula]XP_041118613.1 eotaxin-like [Polyodon spathula]